MRESMDNAVMREGERILTICNACRYCEGYCAVFPALERRANLASADLNYLANLCHNCSECYYACPYAPPHEFAVNVPKTLAEIRAGSYRQDTWPAVLAPAFASNAGIGLIVLGLSVAVWVAAIGGRTAVAAQFYQALSHRAMVAIFGGLSIAIMVVLFTGLARFWHESGEGSADLRALQAGLLDALRLTYLDGGGEGCTYPGEERSRARWWFHHFTFYGFWLCFAATCAAAIYHYVFRRIAPYSYFSLPVVLGTLGGIGLLVGPAGLFRLKLRQDRATRDSNQNGMDISFLALLFSTSATGLLLLALRETSAMSLLLAIHLGIVLALFVTLPYGKFVHAIYRVAALVRYALERNHAKEGNATGD